MEQTDLGRTLQSEHGDSVHGRDIKPVPPQCIFEDGSDQPAHFRRGSSREERSCLCAVGSEVRGVMSIDPDRMLGLSEIHISRKLL